MNSLNWKPIKTAPHNEFVLVACRSGYTTIEWVYLVAKYTAGYHDRWDDEGNDALMDGGYKPEYWCELPEAPDADEEVADSDTMVWLTGSGQRVMFRCECGCNVFKRLKNGKYKCNSCGDTYSSETSDD